LVIILSVSFAALLAVGVWFGLGIGKSLVAQLSKVPHAGPGDLAALYVEDHSKDVPVATSLSTYREMVGSWAPGALEALVTAHEVFFVAPGTNVNVVETFGDARKVRILKGVQVGRLGWVPQSWVFP
jgi:hypothetical protein